MAVSANMRWEIRSQSVSSNNGGGFVEGASGTDYSQQITAHATYTDLVIDAVDATKITSAIDPFAADDVGNVIKINSGTGFTIGRYEVVSVTAAVATLDRAVGTIGSTGGAAFLGGSMVLRDELLETAEPGNIVWVKKDGTHVPPTISVIKTGTSESPIFFQGYNITRGDGGDSESNRPLLAMGANALNFIQWWNVFFIEVTTTASNGFLVSATCNIFGCKSNNTSTTAGRRAIHGGFECNVANCEVQSLKGPGIVLSQRTSVTNCYAHDCGTYGINENSIAPEAALTCCVTANCTTAGVRVDGSLLGNYAMVNLTIYNCGTGILIEGTGGSLITANNIATNVIIDNCTVGIDQKVKKEESNIFANINLSNVTTDFINITAVQKFNITTLDPQFFDAPNGDFRVGINMQSKSRFPGGLMPSTMNLGAIQNKTISTAGLHPIEQGISA